MSVIQKDKVSIIIPVYNIENFITRCLESILKQTYNNIELIVVDDGSDDSSSRIVDYFASHYNNIIVCHTRNKGVTNARIYGVQISIGKYIGFCDGDDFIEKDMYLCLIENMNNYGADISHCGYQMYIKNRVEYFYNTNSLQIHDNVTALKELLSGVRIEPSLGTKVFRRFVFNKILYDNKMNVSIKINEDLLMNYYLFKEANTSVYFDKCYYHYIVHDEPSSVNKHLTFDKLNDPIRVQKTLLLETKDNHELQNIIQGRLAMMYARELEMDCGKYPELIKEHKRMCKKELRLLLPKIIIDDFDIKTKIYTTLALYFPNLCKKIHAVYLKKKGTYGRYDVK